MRMRSANSGLPCNCHQQRAIQFFYGYKQKKIPFKHSFPAIASAIVEGDNLYAFYLLWKQICQDKLAVLDAWCKGNQKENQQAKALCAFSPKFNESALINALI